MSTFIAYIFLFIAVLFGTLSNTFAKNSEGFVKFFPSILSMVTINTVINSIVFIVGRKFNTTSLYRFKNRKKIGEK